MGAAEITRPDRIFFSSCLTAPPELTRSERVARVPLSTPAESVVRRVVVLVGGTSLTFEYRDDGNPRPKWFRGVLAGFAKLAALPGNWDGEGALPVDRQAINRALAAIERLLPASAEAPSIVPLPDSGLQIEWHRSGADLEIEFRPDGDIQFYYYEETTMDEREGPVGPNFIGIRELLPRVW
jgi:hypothetical protein